MNTNSSEKTNPQYVPTRTIVHWLVREVPGVPLTGSPGSPQAATARVGLQPEGYAEGGGGEVVAINLRAHGVPSPTNGGVQPA